MMTASSSITLDAGVPDAAASSSAIPDASVPPDAAVVDSGTGVPDAGMMTTLPDPILFVHGINGAAENWTTMVERFVADGWPRERLMARTFPDPSWGCNVDNAALLQTWANELMTTTGTTRIDVVAHSMGTLSSRHFVKILMNLGVVNTYVTIGGMNHGLWQPCLSPLDVCVWKELCSTGPFITALNAAPTTPPPTTWVSIYSDADTKVPATSSELEGAENIMMTGLMHDGPDGLQESPLVYAEVKRVVLYPGH
jgi:triacylglycerol lipase